MSRDPELRSSGVPPPPGSPLWAPRRRLSRLVATWRRFAPIVLPILLLGGLIKYDWMFVIAAVPVLLRRDRPGAAGAALGVAACMRVFPAVFLGAFVARGLVAWYDSRRLPRRELRIATGFLVAVALGFILGCMAPGGTARWKAFGGGIRLHNHEMTFGNGRVGLAHIFTHDVGSGRFEGLEQRRSNLERQRWLYRGTAAALLLLLAIALRRARELDAFVLATVAFFALSVASHYYWSVIALWVLLGARRDGPQPWPWRAIGIAVALVPTALWWLRSRVQDDDYTLWVRMDQTLLAAFVLLLGYRIVRDVLDTGGPRAFLLARLPGPGVAHPTGAAGRGPDGTAG